MTWTKSNIVGPEFKSWSPNLRLICDVSSPTTTQCPGTISGLTWGDCKYTTFNGEFFGFLNMTITNTGSYPYGGTRNHWDLELPFTVAGINGSGAASKILGRGFWHADSNPDRQGKVIVTSFPHLPWNGSFSFIKTTFTSYDTWAISNLNYLSTCTQWNGASDNTNLWGETAMPNNSWGLRRLASDNSAWPGHSEDSWSAPNPSLTISVWLRYMIQ